MNKKTINRKTAEEAIHFLDRHMLDPTPSNYAFAYLYITGANGWLRKAVDNVIDGGVRLGQREVDDLMNQAPSETGQASASISAILDEHQSHLRHQILSFADLTASALEETGSFNRDLEDNAQKTERANASADLADVIRSMMTRTARIELKLAETRRETERLRQDLDAARDDATRDALTNLPNRRAIDRHLQTFADKQTPLSVAFCDIDHFKAINDRFGHPVGDRVLKVVAQTLSETLTPYVVGRFGGEEFVVVLPELDCEAAFALLEKARIAVSDRHFRVRDTDELIGQITLSAGIAATLTDPHEALSEADKCLYEAKRSGRNRTVAKIAA